ncbi:MAG: hypothetical protein RMK40_02615 [Chloroflexota bacterium]|nr:hypothetical protein [Chloroflexota bacterium]
MAFAHILVGPRSGVAGERQTPAAARFLTRARALGLEVRPLALTLLRQEEGQPPLLRVSWQKVLTVRLLGWQVSLALPQRGRFTFHPVDRVIGTVEAERLASMLTTLPEVDEVAVLVEERVDPILAVRIGERWYECYRWLRRPYIVTSEETLPLPTRVSFYQRAA